MSTINNEYYNNLASLLSGKDNDSRKLSTDQDGNTTVINAGDESVFKAAEQGMGKEQFLTLLVAQLQYQDPLNPAEDTQFVAQLAQFSQLEFTQNSTQAISQLASNMQSFMDMQLLQAQSITNSSATPLLGKDVRVMEAEFEHKGGEREFNIHILEGNKEATVVIRDANGDVIRELDIELEDSNGGDTTIKWDGKDQNGEPKYNSGNYSVEVVAKGANKNAGYAFQEGKVSGVSFSASGAALKVNGINYGLSFLVSVSDPELEEA